MKFVFLLIVTIFVMAGNLCGQNLVAPELASSDSARSGYDELLPELREPVFEIHPWVLISPGKIDFGSQIKELPKIDFNQRLFGFLQDFSYSVTNSGGSQTFTGFSANHPFFVNSTVFNQAAYKISNRFTIGGNSYGYNDIFLAPIPNDLNQYNSRGASMFFQYKVSKNFKIETRVSVNGNQF